MRADRLLSIMILLQLRGRVTAQAFAQEFEVSLRTIYRDVESLSAAGVPVYAERGPGGGFQLLDGYTTRLTGLTSSEGSTLPLAGLSDLAADLGLTGALATAQRKLLAAMPAAAADAAIRVGDRFHLDPVDWYRRIDPPLHLRGIAQAVWDGLRIEIRYVSWSATVRRTLDPLGIVAKAGVWYLVARADKRLRIYRISNVLELAVLDRRFERPAGFDLARVWRAELERFETGLYRQIATLRVAASALARIEVLGDAAASAIRAAAPDEHDWRTAVIQVENMPHTVKLLLGFAGDVEVVAPAALRDEMARQAALILSLYRGG